MTIEQGLALAVVGVIALQALQLAQTTILGRLLRRTLHPPPMPPSSPSSERAIPTPGETAVLELGAQLEQTIVRAVTASLAPVLRQSLEPVLRQAAPPPPAKPAGDPHGGA